MMLRISKATEDEVRGVLTVVAVAVYTRATFEEFE
jgi:hypothetical protein